MNRDLCLIPKKSKIETDQIPIEWLYQLAIREGNSKKPIYRIHKWWARRLGSVFRTLLLLAVTPSNKRIDRIPDQFYSKQDFSDLLVLDPFMGGGTSIIEASKCGARTIGIDIDPVAWFITKKEIEPCSMKGVRSALKRLEESVRNEIQSYYRTKTPHGTDASVIYFFWVDLITCPDCQTEFEAHPHYQLSYDTKRAQQNAFCCNCHSIATIPLAQKSLTCLECKNITQIKSGTVRFGRFNCPSCSHSAKVPSVIKPGQPLPKRLFAVEYEVENAEGKMERFFKAVDDNDVRTFRKAEQRFNKLKDKLPFPREEIPAENRSDLRPINYGYRYYYQLFNPRQLLCLSLLWHEITKIRNKDIREYLMIAFSDSLATNNMLCSYAFGYRKLTPLFGLHAFNIVSRPVENNVWGLKSGRGSFLKCVEKMLNGKQYAYKPYEIMYKNGNPKRVYTGEQIVRETAITLQEWHKEDYKSLLLNRSSTELGDIQSKSIDLILTDPPYYNNLSYSELSDFYYVWLRRFLPKNGCKRRKISTPYQQSLYVNDDGNQSHIRFIHELTRVLLHCKRALKPRGLMVLTYHHRHFDAWRALAEALWRSNFQITNVFPVRSEGKSGFHSTSGTIKWDSVLVCRIKPNNARGLSDRRGFLHSIKARQKRWIHRIQKGDLTFGWADALSLGYAIATQQSIAKASSLDEFQSLLSKANKHLISTLTPTQLSSILRRRGR